MPPGLRSRAEARKAASLTKPPRRKHVTLAQAKAHAAKIAGPKAAAQVESTYHRIKATQAPPRTHAAAQRHLDAAAAHAVGHVPSALQSGLLALGTPGRLTALFGAAAGELYHKDPLKLAEHLADSAVKVQAPKGPPPDSKLPPGLQRHAHPGSQRTGVSRQIPREQQARALIGAVIHGGTKLTPAQHRLIGDRAYRMALHAHHQSVRGRENVGQPSDLTDAILLATPFGPGRAALRAGKAVGERVVASGAAKATERGAQAALEAARASRAGRAGARAAGATRSARAALGTRAESAAARAAASRPAQAAARAARGAGRRATTGKTGVATGLAARGGSRAASTAFSTKGLVGGPFALQAPAAVAHGDPGQFKKALEGTGTYAAAVNKIAGKAGGVVPGVAGNALSDVLELPAQVLPSAYMVGAAGREAASGRPQRLHQLEEAYGRTDFLPALASGDVGEAVKRIGQHPVYAGLEVAGIKAGVGRAAGAAARHGRAPEQRPSLEVSPGVDIHRGPYSRDAITAARQRMQDRRIERKRGGHVASQGQKGRYLRSATDRSVFAAEQVRRGELRKNVHLIEATRPKSKAQADAIAFAVQAIARNPESAVADLRGYRESLIAQRDHLTPSKLAANQHTVSIIDAALEDPHPENLFHAARAYTHHNAPVVKDLIRRGLLDEQQARKAISIPFARVHMNAGHGLSRADLHEEALILNEMKQPGLEGAERGQLLGRLNRIRSREGVLDRHGDALPLDAIEAEMTRQGVAVEDTGFLTQRPDAASASDFYRSYGRRPQLPGERRTGVATAEGTYDPSFEALLHQTARNSTVLETAKNFDHVTHRFGVTDLEGRYFNGTAEARHAAKHPEDFGLDLPEVPGGYVPWRVTPWPTVRRELEAVKSETSPAQPEQLAEDPLAILESDDPRVTEGVMHTAVEHARKPGEGATVLIPKVMADRLADHFKSALPLEKAAQAVTGAFKGAVLPTSPGWFAGNALDNYLVRAGSAGIGPAEIITGRRFAKLVKNELGPEEASRALESIVPGGLYAEFSRVQPRRSAEQFLTTNVEPVARALGTLLRTPGIKQLHDAYVHYRDAVFEFDGKYVEQMPEYGMLSKIARRDLGMSRARFRRAIANQEPAVLDLARGLRNTDAQIRFAKDVEAQFGNWGKNSPEARRFLNTWAPFWMWARAATKFVLLTLPRDHPIKTGLIAAAEQMTREERQKLGFDFNAKLPLPDFLQGGIPGPGGSVFKASSLTSFGPFSDYPQFISALPVPQFFGALAALKGLDWKGDRLTNSDGTPASPQKKIEAAVSTLFEGFVPFLNAAHSASSHGVGGLNPARRYDRGTVHFLREKEKSMQISVPAHPKSKGGSSLPSLSGPSGGSSLPSLSAPSGSSSLPSLSGG